MPNAAEKAETESAPKTDAKPSGPVKPKRVAPKEFSDAQLIGDHLREASPVVVDLNATDADLTRRLIDFCSGSTYVLSGSMERLSRSVFLLIPEGVEVTSQDKAKFANSTN